MILRNIALAVLISLAANPALANGWKIMHLAPSGGSRDFQVDTQAEASRTVAYVDIMAGLRFIVGSCGGYTVSIGQPGGMGPFLLEREQLRVLVDGREVLATRDHQYAQDAHHITVPPAAIRAIANGSQMILERSDATGVRYFVTLSGSHAAFNQVMCR